MERGKHAVVGDIFQGGGSGSFSIWVGDVGDDPPYGPGPGNVPSQGGPLDHGKAATVASGRNLGVPPPLEEAIREEVLEEVEAYVPMRQNTVAQYIET